MKNKFKILTIDGGGIRGVFPAYLLAQIEADLAKRDDGKTKIRDHFDLISGTSTGGIIALALSLGVPAIQIHDLYLKNAKNIFGKKKWFCRQLFYSAHDNQFLEKVIKEKFKEFNNNEDPRLGDCKPHVCIPIYDLLQGNPSVLKTKYHPAFERDHHIPAYKVAMATSAAPTYFNPYSSDYTDLNGLEKPFRNKVDGGVMANNPTLVAFLEAVKAFKKDMSDIEILSIGTGYKKYTEGNPRKNWGLYYWMKKNNRKRLIELFLQSQSQLVDNYISLLYQGIDKSERDNPNFNYKRINVELCEDNFIEMDEHREEKIKNFSELASIKYQHERTRILDKFF